MRCERCGNDMTVSVNYGPQCMRICWTCHLALTRADEAGKGQRPHCAHELTIAQLTQQVAALSAERDAAVESRGTYVRMIEGFLRDHGYSIESGMYQADADLRSLRAEAERLRTRERNLIGYLKSMLETGDEVAEELAESRHPTRGCILEWKYLTDGIRNVTPTAANPKEQP